MMLDIPEVHDSVVRQLRSRGCVKFSVAVRSSVVKADVQLVSIISLESGAGVEVELSDFERFMGFHAAQTSTRAVIREMSRSASAVGVEKR